MTFIFSFRFMSKRVATDRPKIDGDDRDAGEPIFDSIFTGALRRLRRGQQRTTLAC